MTSLKKDELLLSVVMPAHNSARTISLAIKSALVAMPRNSELLVLLDNCSDDTLAKTQISDPRLKVFNPGGAFGITLARNFLLEQATGTYVAVLDSDDIMLPWRFLIQIPSLNRGLDFVASTAVVFGKKLKPLPLVPQVPLTISEANMGLFLSTSNPIVHSTVTFRRSAVNAVGGYPGTWPKEDYNLWLNLAKAGVGMRRSWLPTCLYRFHQSQVTQSSRRSFDPEIIKTIDEAKEQLAQDLGLASSLNDRRKLLYKKLPLARLEQRGLGLNKITFKRQNNV
jgi:glycosyltransferase involved in cell wall biosynthesis